jgi:hypothetical protein
MAIHTSAITYKRGIPNGYTNFFFVTQANNSIIAPMNLYLKNYQFYNRIITNTNNNKLFWKH